MVDLFGGLMERAQDIVAASQPHCEICGGTLNGGALTIVADGQPMITCLKCINNGMDYYMREEMGTRTRFATSLWADGYYVSTAGYISEDKIKKYIDEQSKQEKRQSVIKAIRSKMQKTLFFAPHSHPAVNSGVSLGSC